MWQLGILQRGPKEDGLPDEVDQKAGQHACAHASLSNDDRQRFLAMLIPRAGSRTAGEGRGWNKRL